MELIEELLIAWKRVFKKRAECFITQVGLSDAVTLCNSPGIGINHKNRMFACVERMNRRFLANTANGEKLDPAVDRSESEHTT